MMEYLQRLAPPGNTDRRRAVAVLPSCFACERPLRQTGTPLRPAALRDDDAALHLPDSATPAVAVASNQMRDDLAVPQGTRVLPRARITDALPRDTQTVPAPTGSDVRASTLRADDSTASIEAHDRPAALPGRLASEPGARFLGQPHESLPLSPHVLAQRTVARRDEPRNVHVTIGRIEVSATTAPVPAARIVTPPRKPSVSLADYLRSGKESRP